MSPQNDDAPRKNVGIQRKLGVHDFQFISLIGRG
jgi:hypothetical protein